MKNTLSFYFKTITLSVMALSFAFIAIPAMADDVFLFSDDLSGRFDIDQGQTTAKPESGRFHTADDSVSSSVVSKTIANPFNAIMSARLDVSQSLPSGTRIIYYLSNNGGFKWTQVNPGFTYVFDSVGNELRWKAVIARESPVIASAFVDNINITYTVSASIRPTLSSNRSGNSSLGTVMYGNGGDLTSFVCDAISSIGLGCGAPRASATQALPSPSPSPLASDGTAEASSSDKSSGDKSAGKAKSADSERKVNNSGSGSALQAAIANTTVKRTISDDEVILVKVPVAKSSPFGLKPTLGLTTNDAIFEIIRGQKHFIPTVDIFFDYGFDLNSVQTVTYKDLEQFPRTKLVKVPKDKKNYYITEGYMIRPIPNTKVFESYGDRNEDVITISKKEFNFYPRNQYVFLENPLRADVYQIVNNGTKRYVVPQVLSRLNIRQEQIAPINKVQLNAYKNSAPVIF